MEIDQKKHVVELQSLRGIAALTVLIGHAASYWTAPPWFVATKDLFNGHAAVVMFFLLSGYVLTRSLASRPFTTGTITAFYVKRVFRIFPALWLATVVGLLYLLLLHYNVPVANTSEWFDERFLATRMRPIYVAASFAGMLAFVLPQIWSITVEIFASVAMPAFAYVRLYRPAWFGLMMFALLALSFFVGPRTYYAIGVYLLDFALGVSLYNLAAPIRARLQGIGPRPKKLVFYASAAIMMFARDAVTVLIAEPAFHGPGFQLLEAACAVVMVALVVHGDLHLPLLRWQPVVTLGDVSYSLYLWSFPMMVLLAKAFATGFPLLGLQPSTVALNTLLPISTVALVIPIALLSYRYVELPGIALGRWALGLLRPARPPAWSAVPRKAKS